MLCNTLDAPVMGVLRVIDNMLLAELVSSPVAPLFYFLIPPFVCHFQEIDDMSQCDMPQSREASHDTVPNNEKLTPADPALRLFAHLIDTGIVMVLVVILPVLVSFIACSPPRDFARAFPGWVFFFALSSLFWAAAWGRCWFNSSSPGKDMMGLYAIDSKTGKPLGLGNMILREVVGKWISGMIFSLGYIWILIDKDKQGWHDKLVNSIVVKRPKPG